MGLSHVINKLCLIYHTPTSRSLHLSSSFFSFPRNSTTFSKYFDNREAASPGARLLSLVASPWRSLSVRSWPLTSSFCLLAMPSFLNSIAASNASMPSSSSISLQKDMFYSHFQYYVHSGYLSTSIFRRAV